LQVYKWDSNIQLSTIRIINLQSCKESIATIIKRDPVAVK
jgi:hypothetical protein